MPELPEVETIKRVIEPQIQGLMIDKVNVKRPEVVAYPAADEITVLRHTPFRAVLADEKGRSRNIQRD